MEQGIARHTGIDSLQRIEEALEAGTRFAHPLHCFQRHQCVLGLYFVIASIQFDEVVRSGETQIWHHLAIVIHFLDIGAIDHTAHSGTEGIRQAESEAVHICIQLQGTLCRRKRDVRPAEHGGKLVGRHVHGYPVAGQVRVDTCFAEDIIFKLVQMSVHIGGEIHSSGSSNIQIFRQITPYRIQYHESTQSGSHCRVPPDQVAPVTVQIEFDAVAEQMAAFHVRRKSP